MKGRGRLLAACVASAALLVPAATSAAEDAGAPAPSANRPPLALLSATSLTPTTGSPVTFDASSSSDPDGAVARYEWDFDGDGAYETEGGATRVIERAFDRAGPREVGLRVTDDGGASAEGVLSLDVAAPSTADDVVAPSSAVPADPEPPPASALATPSRSATSPPAPSSPAAPVPATPAAVARPAEATGASPSADPPTTRLARAAATTSVTISDFRFAPGTITVDVGDTVRWTNAGPTGHSATGSGFDTGILAKGSSGSATFSKAGTFSYVCTPHPFMKGTVVVRAASSGGSGSGGSSSGDSASGGSSSSGSSSSGSDLGGSSSSGSSATGSTASTASGSGGSLPTTGTNVVLVALIGAGLLAAGLALRLVPGARRRAG